jgi:hypothetical protein
MVPDASFAPGANMSSSDVRDRVEQEIGSDWGRSNPHGIDLSRCLVHPERRHFCDSFNQNRTIDLWLVLEQDTKTHEGYKIVFDEGNCKYGLAICGQEGCDVFIGYYGTFIETLDAM